jgi:hypothetical protein
VASPSIVHSHNRPAYYHLRRSYVEHLALLEMVKGYPVAPGDRASAAEDIVSSCAAIDALILDDLQVLPVPCPPQEVRDAVANGLRKTTRPGASEAARDYLDDRTRAFVKRLQGRRMTESGGPDPGRGSLVEAVASMGGMICDYLDDKGETVDRDLFDELKSALYKGWALHCGVRLASVYWRGPADVRESLRAEHEELMSGV